MATFTIDLLTGDAFLFNKGFNGSGGTTPYSNSTPTSVTIGGIDAGTTFTNKTIKEMWDMLLYPYQIPAFTSFVIQGQTSPVEVGDSILSNRTFTWGTLNSGNIQTNSITIRDVTNGINLAINLPNDGSETVVMSAITKIIATSHTFRISAINSKIQSFQRDYSINWQWRIYYGENVSSPLTEANIKTLRINGLGSGFAGTYVFNSGGYKYLSYPAVFGSVTTFKDQATNLDIPIEPVYVVSLTNGFGITTNYNVYRTTNIIGSAINIIVT